MSRLSAPKDFGPTDIDAPLVSVILPTYEDEEYIDAAITSVVEQTYSNVELIIVDSSDVDRLSEFADRTNGVIYLHSEPAGVAAARNRGISAADGELIAFLDADDYWTAEKLSTQVPRLRENADIVYSDQYVVEDGCIRSQQSLPVEDPETHYVDYFRSGEGVPSRTVVVDASCLNDERFDESLTAHEDPHLWTRLFEEYTPDRIPETLAYKRQRPDSLTGDYEMVYENELAAIGDLVDRYDELAQYCTERKRRAAYRYGRTLLRGGNQSKARCILRSIVGDSLNEPRILVLLSVSLLPTGHRWVLHNLERINGRL